MASWSDLESAHPDFGSRVRALFDAGLHKTMATVRSDGSPRISGTEIAFRDGAITLGMMSGSVKLADVRRDPRVAIHSPTVQPVGDTSNWPGEAKLSATLREIDPPDDHPDGGAAFVLDLTEVVLTSVRDNEWLVVESWHPGRGYERRERR